MKKLSIIMVIAMLLTTFMAIVPTAAAEPVVATPDAMTQAQVDKVLATTDRNGAPIASADATGAIGYFKAAEGVDPVYVTTLRQAGFVVQALGAEGAPVDLELVLVANVAETKGWNDPSMDLGDVGNSLTINGNGNSMTSSGRAFHYNGTFYAANSVNGEDAAFLTAPTYSGTNVRKSDAATLVFKNIDIAVGAMQINGGLTLVFDEGVDATFNTSLALVISQGTKLIVNDGATLDASNVQRFITPNGGKVDIEINGGTIKGQRIMQTNANCDLDVVINGGRLEAKKDNYMLDVKAHGGGTFNFVVNDVDAEYTGNYGFIMLESSTGYTNNSVTINGGTFNGTNKNAAVVYNHNSIDTVVTINGGEMVGMGSLIRLAGGSLKSLTINDGDFVSTNAANGVLQLSAGSIVESANIYGGNFEAKAGRVIQSTSDGYKKTTNIYGGTFKSYAWGNDVAGNVGVTSATQCNIGYIYASGGAINVYGGNFYLCDANGALTDKGAHIAPFSGAFQKSTIYGGKFYGGEYALCSVAYAKADTGKDKDGATIMEELSVKTTNGQALLNPTLNTGASVRLDTETSGLRFSSTISAECIAYMNAKFADATITYGTVITAANYLKYTNNVFTMEALDAAGRKYLNIVAENGIVENADGSLTINAAMVNIKEENYGRDFVAIPYILITLADGEEIYLYDSTNIGKTARNISEVAVAALADVKAESTGAYTNAVSEYYVYNGAARKYELTYGTAYSKYTAAEVAILKSYIVG